MGRPKKYTERTLRKAVEAYFDSITREVGMTEKVDTGRKDSSGHKIFENVPVINKRGEQVKYTEYLVPPTVGGMCEYLEIHRSTWAEYCDESLHPEFSDTTTRTRGRMREYLEQQLLIRKDVKGITRVSRDYIYETTLAEAATGAVVGTKLQVEAGGLTASKPATGSGTFEVVALDGTAAGDAVRGRWV